MFSITRLSVRFSLPRKCFISHAYEDASLGHLDALKAALPWHVEPVIFPPIKVAPDARVSDDLTRAILDCSGLIVVKGPHSQHSVWVNFERDFAMRAGRKVFNFDPGTRRFSVDSSPTEPMHILFMHSQIDDRRVNEIMKFMKNERGPRRTEWV